MNALIDTNVAIDVLTKREPFHSDSARVLSGAERGDFTAWLCATTITTIFYLVRRHLGSKEAIYRLRDLTSICSIAPVNQAVVDSALSSSFADFEDAVLDQSAMMVGADCIVTRNESDFRKSTRLIYSPAQFMRAIGK